MKRKNVAFVALTALLLTGCGNDTEIPEAPPEIDVITVDGKGISMNAAAEDITDLLGDSAWICGPADFSDAKNDEYFLFLLDEGSSRFFSPNYDKDGLAEKFRVYNGLTGASERDEIAEVLGSGCIRVSDDEGEHFCEVFLSGSEIDYSAYDLSGTFDEVFERVYDECYGKLNGSKDTMIIYCFNCAPDGSVDGSGGHIAEITRNTSE